jgi:Putative MetA-pathway of phenol degradation
MKHALACLLLTLTATWAHADTPAFDRPGIAFSTQTLPAGSVSWEQGLPDVVHNDDQGTQSTLYSADTRIRVGLIKKVEFQIAAAPYNRLQTRSEGVSTVDHGASDVNLALKVALPSTQNFSWAVLANVALTTGSAAFTNDTQQYSLAASANLHLSHDQAVGFYIGTTRAGQDNTYTLSPNFSFPLSGTLSSYVEAGYTFGDHRDDDVVAGGGLAWMVGERLQLDVYALHGLTARSTDVQAGVGVSLYFP